MFFTSPKSQVKELLHFLHKKFKYNRDLLAGKRLEQYLQLESDVQGFLTNSSGTEGPDVQLKAFQERALKLFPAGKDAGIQENVEVFFVAIVIALALRTFFLQPFVIPTDSMKPTLYGIPVESRSEPPPSMMQKTLDFLIEGKTYVYIEIPKGGRVDRIADTGPFGIDLLGYIPFVDRTRLAVGGQSYILDGTPNELFRATGLKMPDRAGEPVPEIPDNTTLNYAFGAGDHVFVNKFIYHFRKPERGDVFVFTTENIRGIQERLSGVVTSQFYIKRCVGLPGDVLQIKPPFLYNNGKILDSRPIFEKIYSGKNGYAGYGTGNPDMLFLRTPNETYQVPKDGYWAMGDNSYNSLDSRYWGKVPAENLVGTGLLVYWPFSNRWGLIP